MKDLFLVLLAVSVVVEAVSYCWGRMWLHLASFILACGITIFTVFNGYGPGYTLIAGAVTALSLVSLRAVEEYEREEYQENHEVIK